MIPNPEIVSEPAFERLVEGAESDADVAHVLAYEASINLAAAEFLKDDCDTLPQDRRQEARRLWRELEAMHEQHPDEFEKMWQYPLVTARWRAFMDTMDDEGRVSEEQCQKTLLELSTITGALAIRCGDVTFEGDVAVHNGRCMLPTLGAIMLPSMSDRVRMQVKSGKASLHYTDELGESERVTLPEGIKLTREGPAWQPIREFTYPNLAGELKRLLIDDLDPYRECFGQNAIRERLTLEECELWFLSLHVAIGNLLSLHNFHAPYPPETIDAMLQGVQVLVPLKPLGGRMATATSINALGAIGLSRAPDTLTLGEALVHEYQHTKLTGLLNQHRLFEPVTTEAVHYAPWRGDPRPVMGLLHGLYASVGIMKYWQRQVQQEDNRQKIAYAKKVFYSAWAYRVQAALPTLEANVIPTEAGRSVLRYLQEEVASIESLPPSSHHAHMAVLDHMLSWRVDNCRPDRTSIDTLAAAFIEGQPLPLSLHALPPSIIERQATAGNFRQLVFDELFKMPFTGIDTPEGFPKYYESKLGVGSGGRKNAWPLQGCPEADAVLVITYPDSGDAQLLYRQSLQTTDDPVVRRSLWPGYLVALDAERSMPQELLQTPELYYYLYEAVVEQTGNFDPLELVTWLNNISTQDTSK